MYPLLQIGLDRSKPLLISRHVDTQASDRVYYIHQTLADAETALVSTVASHGAPEGDSADPQGIVSSVEAALCDDLNTPQAIALLSEPLKSLNDLLHTKKVKAHASAAVLLCLAPSTLSVRL